MVGTYGIKCYFQSLDQAQCQNQKYIFFMGIKTGDDHVVFGTKLFGPVNKNSANLVKKAMVFKNHL